MENNDYRRYVNRLHEVRSPIGTEDVLRLLGRSTKKRTMLPWLARFTSFVVLITLGGSQIQSSRVELPSPPHEATVVVSPSFHQSAIAAKQHLAASVKDKPNTNRGPRVQKALEVRDAPSEQQTDTSLDPIPSGPPVAATPLPVAATPLPTSIAIRAIALQPYELPMYSAGPSILTITTDLQHPAATQVAIEYPISSHLTVGILGGFATHTSMGTVADVRFRDTTVQSNGNSYTSTIGELVPQQRSVALGTIGLALRLFANPIESGWNISVELSQAYSSTFSSSAELAGRYQIAGPFWIEAGAELQEILNAERHLSGRLGCAWQW